VQFRYVLHLKGERRERREKFKVQACLLQAGFEVQSKRLPAAAGFKVQKAGRRNGRLQRITQNSSRLIWVKVEVWCGVEGKWKNYPKWLWAEMGKSPWGSEEYFS